MKNQQRGVHFAGRLGTYKYYNMDQMVAQAEYKPHYMSVRLPEQDRT